MIQKTKNVILYVNSIRGATIEALKDYEKFFGIKPEVVVIADEAIYDAVMEANGQRPDGRYKLLCADFSSPHSLRKVLAPYKHRILAVSSQYENSIDELTKIIPYVPYLETPTQSSLQHSTEKLAMRTHLEAYDERLVPLYMRVHSSGDITIQRIEKRLSYPLVIKPSGLAGSQLVSLVNNHEELKRELKKTFRVINDAYEHELTRRTPIILVEEFMQGEMYSLDMYIDKTGKTTPTPLVHVTTGRARGFDDFFGYMRLTPTDVATSEVKKAGETAEAAVKALHLRSMTAHVELMHTPRGWKVIELGPRMGGYRHEMYSLSYGINHIMNDILTRQSITPIVPKATLGYTAVFNLYAKSEGIIESFGGMSAIERLRSFVGLSQKKQIGDLATFAKNNGEPVLSITLFHADRDQLAKDIHHMEQSLDIKIASEELATLTTF